jgi:hypothetical protein
MFKNIVGDGVRPSDKDFYAVAKEQYKKKGDENVKNYKLMFDSPTVKAYLDDVADTIILSVRGTSDFRDVKADASIAINRLKYSDRYVNDKNIIDQLAQRYPYSKYDYYLVGHSLGGALINQLKRDFPWLKDNVQFNPAFQPYDLISQQSKDSKRFYTPDDPLYNLGGRFFSNKIIVDTQQPTIKMPSNIASDAFNYYQGHSLDNFDKLLGGSLKIIDSMIKGGKITDENLKEILNIIDDLNKWNKKYKNKKRVENDEGFEELSRIFIRLKKEIKKNKIVEDKEIVKGGLSQKQGFIRKYIAKNFIDKNTPLDYDKFNIKEFSNPSEWILQFFNKAVNDSKTTSFGVAAEEIDKKNMNKNITTAQRDTMIFNKAKPKFFKLMKEKLKNLDTKDLTLFVDKLDLEMPNKITKNSVINRILKSDDLLTNVFVYK